jgi:hypothetical protein
MTLAHAYLTKDEKLIGPWDLLSPHEAPSFHAECLLLLECAKYAILGVLCAFEVEYSELKPILAAAKPQPGRGPGIQRGTEMQAELRRLAVQADRLLADVGVAVGGAIAREFAAAEGF